MDGATQRERKTNRAPRPYHKGHVAEDMRAAAIAILAKERLEDVTLRRLTREVGVTPANFYNHFPSVDDLLMDIAADGFDELRLAASQAWDRDSGKIDRLVILATEFVRFGCRKPQLLRLMFGYRANGGRHRRFHHAANNAFAELVRLIYDEDRFDPEDSAASHEHCRIAYGFFAFCYGLARTVGTGQFDLDLESGPDLDHFVERTVRPFLDGSVIETVTSSD